MNTQSDQWLLQDYARHASEEAFAELVRRHVDLVYSTALRMVCNPQQAEDVTQGVFVALAQNANHLVNHPVLSGWLHRTTRNLAANAIRAGVRRQTHEKEAVVMNELLSNDSDDAWKQIALQLDVALGELSVEDRDSVLLRYFERKSAREMSAILGITAQAAQKRVNRAVERLRGIFSKRGICIGGGGLAVLISTRAVQSAPAALATAISKITIAGTAVTSTSTVVGGTTKTFVMTTLQKTLVGAALAVAILTDVYVIRQNAALRDQNQRLQQQLGRFQQAQADFAVATNKLDRLMVENNRLKTNSSQMELLRLRGEVTRLRPLEQDINALKNRLSQSSAGLPEWTTKEVRNVGQAMPLDALQTFLFAEFNEEKEKKWNCIVVDGATPPTDAAVQDFVNKPTKLSAADITSFRVLSQTWISPQETQLELNARLNGGYGVSFPITLRNVDGEWKLVLFKGRVTDTASLNHLSNDSPSTQ